MTTSVALFEPQHLVIAELIEVLGKRGIDPQSVSLWSLESSGNILRVGGDARLVQDFDAANPPGDGLWISPNSSDAEFHRTLRDRDLPAVLIGEGLPTWTFPWLADGFAGAVKAPPAGAVLIQAVVNALAPNAVSSLHATLFEPASRLGSDGIDELFEQTKKLLAFQQDLPTTTLGAQSAFNAFPLERVTAASDAALRDLLPDTRCSLLAVQSGSFHGLGAHLTLELEEPIEQQELDQRFEGHGISSLPKSGLVDSAGSDRPRIGWSAASGRQISLWVTVDQVSLEAAQLATVVLDRVGQPPQKTS